jgi:hypothetical protein
MCRRPLVELTVIVGEGRITGRSDRLRRRDAQKDLACGVAPSTVLISRLFDE